MTGTAEGAVAARPLRQVDAAKHRRLEAPILPLLIGLAWPNMLIMVAQASTDLSQPVRYVAPLANVT